MTGFYQLQVCVLLAGLALATPSLAQSSQDNPGRITPTTASSACIGSAATPLCAVETLLACLTRNDDALCRRVGVAPPARNPDAIGPLQAEYAIERVTVIRPDDITDDTRDLEWFKPGYTLVEVSRRLCPASESDCDGLDWEYLQVYLGPPGTSGGPWQIVTWRGDSEDDTTPEIPDAFQRQRNDDSSP
jgi:hypothetical protein